MERPKYYFLYLILCVLIVFNCVFQIVSSIPLGTINRVFESGGDLTPWVVIDIFRQKAVWMKSEIIGPVGILMGYDEFGVRDFLLGVFGLIIVSGLIKLKKWAWYAFPVLFIIDFILTLCFNKQPFNTTFFRVISFQYALPAILTLYLLFQRKVFR